MPDRSDRVNDMPGGKSVAFGDLGIACCAATEGTAFSQQLRPGRAMNRAVDTAAAEQRFIRSVDDGVNVKCGDVAGDDFEPPAGDFARCRGQAEAGAAVATPLSANSCCNSPA